MTKLLFQINVCTHTQKHTHRHTHTHTHAHPHTGTPHPIELLVVSHGQQNVPRGDELSLVVPRCIACQLQHLCTEVLQDSCQIHWSTNRYPRLQYGLLQVSVDPKCTRVQSNRVALLCMCTVHIRA